LTFIELKMYANQSLQKNILSSNKQIQ